MSLYLGENLISGAKPINLGVRNIGEIVYSSLPLTDAGLHLLDGSLLQYGIYKEFIDYIADLYAKNPSANYFTTEALWQKSVTTYGSCGKFVYNATDNTVRLPKVSDILQGTTDLTAIGDLVEAGLPNIWYSNGGYTSDPTIDGALSQGSRYNIFQNESSSSTRFIAQCSFDASRCSSIYGNSSTVQPQTIKVLYYIVIANSTKTDIQVDIDEIATDLNGKADVDLTNVNNAGTSRGASWAMPSNKYINLTLGASGSTYTAPANGYYYLRKQATTAGQAFEVGKTDGLFTVTNTAGINENWCSDIIPVKKGDIIYISYTLAGTTVAFRFIYAQGSESEV